jgi:hypothetical protein
MRGIEWIKLGAGTGQVADCCKPGKEFLVSMKCEEFHHQLTDNHILKTTSDQRISRNNQQDATL